MLYFEPSQMKIVKALIKGISDPKSRTIQKKKLGFQQFYLPFIYSLQIFYSSICWLPFLQTLIHWFLPLVKYGSKDDLNLFWVNPEVNQFTKVQLSKRALFGTISHFIFRGRTCTAIQHLQWYCSTALWDLGYNCPSNCFGQKEWNYYDD